MMQLRCCRNLWPTLAILVTLPAGAMLLSGCITSSVVSAVAGVAAGVVVIKVIAKYKANEAQKAAAEAKVREAFPAAARPGSDPAAVAPAPAPRKKSSAIAMPAGPSGAPLAATTLPEPEAPAMAARPIPGTDVLDKPAGELPPYIAVAVPRQEIKEERRGKATYMLWDTHKQQLASDDVYVLKNDVREGSMVKLDGVKAQVAGGK